MYKKDKVHYPLKKVKRAIRSGNYALTHSALKGAKDCFGWSRYDIERAFLKLKPKNFLRSKIHTWQPNTMIDHYGGIILSEDIYTHFHFENGRLLIPSFKKNED